MNKKVAEKDLNNLSKRLKFLMDTAGVKQVHLASKLGVTPQAINYLCNGNTKSSKHTKELAKLLNANERWLAFGDGGPFADQASDEIHISGHRAPIFFLDQLKKINIKTDFNKLNPVEFHWCSDNSPGAFGVYVNDNKLAPRFEKDDIVILQGNLDIKNGKLALVYSNELKELLLCYLYKSKDEKILCGFLPHDNVGVFFITKDDFIYGTFQESFKKA